MKSFEVSDRPVLAGLEVGRYLSAFSWPERVWPTTVNNVAARHCAATFQSTPAAKSAHLSWYPKKERLSFLLEACHAADADYGKALRSLSLIVIGEAAVLLFWTTS